MAKSFLEYSTIHGFKYLTKEFHIVERIFWVISLIFSVICTTLLIIELIVKIQNVPIISFVSDKPIPVNEVNFPAVTICSGLISEIFWARRKVPYLNPFKASSVFEAPVTNRDDLYGKNSFEMLMTLEDYYILGRTTYLSLMLRLDNNSTSINQNFNIRILKRLQVVDLVTRWGMLQRKNISIPTDNFLFHFNELEKSISTLTMRFYGKHTKVSEILTQLGLCYTFNLAPSSNVFNDELVSADFHHNYFYLRRIVDNKSLVMPRSLSEDAELEITVAAEEDFYELIFNDVCNCHLLYIHNSHELPTQAMFPAPMHKFKDGYLWIEPQLHSIDESLIDMKPIERMCYLEHEKVLKFFKVYTKYNCEHECLAEFVLQRCGCVEFFMIRNFTTRICSGIEKDCFDRARVDFDEHKSSCECLEPCNYIKYNAEIRLRTVDSFQNVANYNFLYKGHVVSRISASQINRYVRKKQFNEVDFLSFVGGLLGLFAGFSALSFVEIVYWIFWKVKDSIWMRVEKKTKSKVVQVDSNFSHESNKKHQNLLEEYFSESSIHGFNYLTGFSIFEWIFWLVALVFSISICATLIVEASQKMPDSRVVSFDENLDTIEYIPFPAVTYTSHVVGNSSKFLHKLDGAKERLSEKAYQELEAYVHKEYSKFFMQWQGDMTYNVPGFEHVKMELKDYSEEVIRESSLSSYFVQQFASFNQKFNVNFSEVLVGNVLGISFNLFDAERIFNLDEVGNALKYIRNISMNSVTGATAFPNSFYPIHVATKHKRYEFVMQLQRYPDPLNQELTKLGLDKISIHPIDVYPNLVHHKIYLVALCGTKLRVEVTPEITRTDEGMRNLDPKIRECYFEDERPLKFFKNYSEVNCNAECLTNVTFQVCGCVLFTQIYSPRYGIKFCLNYTEYECAYTINEIYSVEKKKCACLQSCNQINYKTKYYPEKDHDNPNIFQINVRLNTEDVVLYRRYQQFTFYDVISYVGGLLGLFAGISVLSFFELLYFFTLRPITKVLRVRKRIGIS